MAFPSLSDYSLSQANMGFQDDDASFLPPDNVTEQQLAPPVRGAGVEPPIDTSEFDYHLYFEDLDQLSVPWSTDRAFWPTTVTYGLTFTIGIIGNCLVVFALLCDRKARNVTSSFLVSLAVADLCFLVVCVPYETILQLNMYWAGGTVLCKVAGFVEMLSACASVLNLAAVSVERYIVIVHPMKSRSWCTMSNTKKIIVTVWIVAILLSSPILYVMDTTVGMYYNNITYAVTLTCADSNVRSVSERLVFAWYQLTIMFLVPVLVMVYCYSIVIHVLWLSTKQLAKMTQTFPDSGGNGSDDESRNRLTLSGSRSQMRPTKRILSKAGVKTHSSDAREARKQVIKMLLTIIAVFLLCWGPKLILNIMKRHEMDILHTNGAFYAGLVIVLLPCVQSCSNPIIYGFMSNNFRRSMRTSCRIYCRCCSCRHRRRGRNDYDLDNKTNNGISTRYSPPTTSKTTGKTYATVVSEC